MITFYKLFKIDKDGKEKLQTFKKDKKTLSEFYVLSEVDKFVSENKGEFVLKTFVK